MTVDPRMFAPFNLGDILQQSELIRKSRHTRERETEEDARNARSRAALSTYLLNGQDGPQQTAQIPTAPTLGSLAPPDSAWAAAVRADPQAAQEARGRQITQSKGELDLELARLGAIAQLAGSVSDQPSYTAALQRARGMGLNVDHLPPNYNPAIVQQVLSEAQTASQQVQSQRDRWVPVGERGLIRIDAQGNPVGEGNPYAPQEAAPAPRAMSESELRARAAAAIRRGADPAAVNQRLEQMLGGGGGQPTGPGNFR